MAAAEPATTTIQQVPSETCSSADDLNHQMELFDIGEVNKGRCLGHGGFADVFEVRSFRKPPDDALRFSEHRTAARQHYRNTSWDSKTKTPRYVIKALQPKWGQDEKKFKMAVQDITTEAQLLAKCHHPNVVQVHGWSADGMAPSTSSVDGYFIIMDRLSGTLDDKLASWKRQQRLERITPHLHLLHPLQHHTARNKPKDLLVERLTVAYDISSALSYLHEERIVYRDLKPANVGFDEHGHVKLFDFGLARTLPPTPVRDDLYKMTARVGTLRFMSPEVYKKEPYNLLSDVYSLALVLWELLALDNKVYRDYSHDLGVMVENVFYKHARPTIHKAWPVELQTLLQQTWSPDIKERPPMEHVSIVLKKQVAELTGDHTSMHSTGQRRHSSQILTLATQKSVV